VREPEIKILINNMVINDTTNPRETLSELLRLTPNLHLWSPDAIKKLIIGNVELLTEFFLLMKDDLKEKISKMTKNTPEFKEFKKRATTISRFITWGSKLIDRYTDWNEEENAFLTSQVYHLILAGEGQGILGGFGYINKSKHELKRFRGV
jgi:hypothetical protein